LLVFLDAVFYGLYLQAIRKMEAKDKAVKAESGGGQSNEAKRIRSTHVLVRSLNNKLYKN
jgi:hypothetical protein